MTLNLNAAILATVITRAKASAADSPRWVAAIERAARELTDNPFIEALDDHTLLLASASGECYTANGVCGCSAFNFKQPCWHRAAARLYQRYVEAEKRKAAAAHALAQINELF